MLTRRRGFTLIEILLVMALIGIFAGWAVTRVNYSGLRMDAAARMLQNLIIGAQQTAITKATDVTLRFDRVSNHVEILFTESGSPRSYTRPLPEGARFMSPTAGIGGAAVDFVDADNPVVTGNTFQRDIIISANGTVPRGDFRVYLGTTSARPNDQRALAVRGATMRVAFWSHSSGQWAVKDY